MPLLMIDAGSETLPKPADIVVAGGTASALIVRAGQLLAIRDLDGGQPAGLFAVSLADPALFLSPHHTRVFSNSFMLRLGMRIVSNKRRTMMVLGVSPAHLQHDLLMPLTEAASNGETGGGDQVRSKVRAALAGIGCHPVKIPDPVNLFLDVAVNMDGSLSPSGVSSAPGDAVVFRVVADLAVAVIAPAPDSRLWSRPAPGPIAVRVRNEVADLADWTNLRRSS
jgi:hypothetical protein